MIAQSAVRVQGQLRDYLLSPDPEKRASLLEGIVASPGALTRAALGYLLDQAIRVQELLTVQEELRQRLECLTAVPGYQGVLTRVHGSNGQFRAEVALGGSSVEVAVLPEVEAQNLGIGDTVVLNAERTCIVTNRGYQVRSAEVAMVEESLSDGESAILSLRDERVVARLARPLLGNGLKSGSRVRYDRSTGLAFDLLPQAEERPDRAYVVEDTPATTLDDIGGHEALLKTLRECLELPLIHDAAFRRYGLAIPRGVLLHGPTGCGKTTIARGLVSRLGSLLGTEGSSFIAVKGPEILSPYVGESEARLRAIFRGAKALAARNRMVTIFFDEIDAIGRVRGNHLLSGVDATLTPTLLTEVQGFSSEKAATNRVLLVAATNRPDLLDPALLRRFDLCLEVPRPSRQAGRDVLAKYLRAEWVDPSVPDGADGIIEGALTRIYGGSDQHRMMTIVYRDGDRQPIYRADLVTGAILENAASMARRSACIREIELQHAGGVQPADLDAAIDTLFRALSRALRPHNLREHLILPADREVVSIEQGPCPAVPAGALRPR